MCIRDSNTSSYLTERSYKVDYAAELLTKSVVQKPTIVITSNKEYHKVKKNKIKACHTLEKCFYTLYIRRRNQQFDIIFERKYILCKNINRNGTLCNCIHLSIMY